MANESSSFAFKYRPDGLEMAWPQKSGKKIYPVFLPFQGCPQRCVFCAQNIQTGQKEPDNPAAIANLLAGSLEELAAWGGDFEVAFYGGTFTGLSDASWRICMDFVKEVRSRGLAATFRCSTRPDFLEEGRLETLKNAGFGLIELGIQSFSSHALAMAGRCHDRQLCKTACGLVKGKGFRLCAQLMPGMPGSSPEIFLDDVRTALDAGADFLRFYPCIVLRNTLLEQMWHAEKFRPWNMEETVETLAKGWLAAAARQIPVTRMGLAWQKGLENSIVAGPWHPALGSRVLGRALLIVLDRMRRICAGNEFSVLAPTWTRGCFFGWRGENLDSLEKMGIRPQNVRFDLEPALRLIKIC